MNLFSSLLQIETNKAPCRSKCGNNTNTIFTPSRHYQQDAAFSCRAKAEEALLPVDNFHSNVKRFIHDDLFRLFGLHFVPRHMT